MKTDKESKQWWLELDERDCVFGGRCRNCFSRERCEEQLRKAT